MNYRLICADVLDGLRSLPDESVQCVVTSPPYWGLRDYGVEGQMGLESTPDEYVRQMVAAFAEVRRVLRKDGTLWLNIGDSYSGSGKGGNPEEGKQATNRGSQTIGTLYGKVGETAKRAAVTNVSRRLCAELGMQPKQLIGVPWRLAFGLQAAGWYLRSDIIWSKPNPMPESVTDRPTKAHEYLFLLTKSARYYYDADAIKERGTTLPSEPDANGSTNSGGAYGRCHLGEAIPEKERRTDKQRGHSRRHAGFNDRWDGLSRDEQCAVMRNKRSVWTIATEPFPEAHFATFPTALVEPCILAGSRVGDVIIDPFSGSGTTGVVALSHQRSFIGIELNPAYVEMSRRRLQGVAPLLAKELTA